MEHAVHSLIPVMVVLLAGIIGAAVMKAVRLTPILGFFIAGIVIGPSALGLVPPSELMTLLAEIGVVLLLFDIGLHLSFRQMWRLRHDLFILGPLQMIAASGVIGVSAYLFGLSWQASLVIGAGLGLSSTAIVMQLLKEKNQSSNPLGQTATSILVFQDILIVFLLILVPALGQEGEVSLLETIGMTLLKAGGALVTVYVVGKYILQPLLAKVITFAKDELFTASILLIIITTASFTGYAGLSLPLGAFLAGLIISETTFCYMVKAEIQPFRTLLLGVFFISAGMTLDVNFLAANWPTIMIVVSGLMVMKIITLIPMALLRGRTPTAATQLGLWLSQAGEFGFVLFALAYTNGLFGLEIYQLLMVAIGVSFVLTPAMIACSDRLGKQADCSLPEGYEGQNKVLIFGFSMAGKNLARLLHGAGIAYLAIDRDLLRVSIAKSQGFNVALGDPAQASLYDSVRASEARAAVFALGNDANVETYAARFNNRFETVPCFINVGTSYDESSLSKTLAKALVRDEHENGSELSKRVLAFLGIETTQTQRLIDSLITKPAIESYADNQTASKVV